MAVPLSFSMQLNEFTHFMGFVALAVMYPLKTAKMVNVCLKHSVFYLCMTVAYLLQNKRLFCPDPVLAQSRLYLAKTTMCKGLSQSAVQNI